MTRPLLLAVILLFALTSQVTAQQERNSRRDCDPGPIAALLNLEAELALTPDQVTALTAIDQEMARKNEHLIAQVVDFRRKIKRLGKKDDMTAAERLLYEEYVDRAKPLLKRISYNNEMAMKEVGTTLTQVQKDTIEQRLQEKEAFRDRNGNVSHCRNSGR